jgi:hypothetical protein
VLWRLPARLITGPLAFFVAGVLDVLAFALHSARRSSNYEDRTS